MAANHDTTALDPPLQFPNEIFQEIIVNLHYLRDRSTLLNLALTSKAWRSESQRVLFSIVGDDSMDLDKRDSLIHAHILFLKAIILNPTRLGSYVKTYKQRGLACPPRPNIALSPVTQYLWDLTAGALPALVNLKHLLIIPRFGEPLDLQAPFNLLEGCTFKLETLQWGFDVLTSSNSDSFVGFLGTQDGLLHLEVGSLPTRQDLSWLPDDACPSLTSASCRLDSAAYVMDKRRHMVGLTTESDWDPQETHPPPLSGLRRFKYLSLTTHRDFMSLWGAIHSNTVLLELTNWNLGTIKSLTGLLNLRFLALLRTRREEPASRMYRQLSIDVKAEYNLRVQLTIESFRQCPNLEHVIIEDVYRGDNSRRFRKMTVSGPIDGLDASPDIRSEEFFIHHEIGLGTPWWTAYGV